MRAPIKIGEKTVVQKLSELVDWWVRDQGVQIKFVPCRTVAYCKIVPGIEAQYILQGRRITDKALSMLCMIDLQAKNYNFNLAKIISAMSALTWHAYMEQENGNYQPVRSAAEFDVYGADGSLIEPGVTKINTTIALGGRTE